MAHISRRNLPSHSVLRSFEAAARHESFTLAAEELHLTQGAISRQVKELEQIVGTELFRRVGRRVVLTMAGRNLASDLAQDLKNIHRTLLSAISAGAVGSALRVACLPTFASRWLIPRLPLFFEQNPDIEISLSTRQEPFDLGAEHFDMAVHFGKSNWPGADMVHLCNEQFIAVGTPAFCDIHQVRNISDLVRAPLLHVTSRPEAWSVFFEKTNVVASRSAQGKYFDQFNMTISAALSSLGAALVPTYLIETEIADGKLCQIGESVLDTENGYYLATPAGETNANVERLAGWMKAQVQRK